MNDLTQVPPHLRHRFFDHATGLPLTAAQVEADNQMWRQERFDPHKIDPEKWDGYIPRD